MKKLYYCVGGLACNRAKKKKSVWQILGLHWASGMGTFWREVFVVWPSFYYYFFFYLD